MSQSSTEPNPQGQQPNEDGQQNNGNPAWEPILSELPEELHGLIKPHLEKWDQSVQAKLQGLHEQYDPYKELVENKVPADAVQQALYFASQFQNNPQQVIEQAIEAFGLDYVPKGSNDDDDEDDFDLDDLEDDPRLAPVMETLKQLQSRFDQEDQTKEQQQQIELLEKTLADLETEHGSFDKLYVTALMTQGVDPAEAVKTYQKTVSDAIAAAQGQQTQTKQPPPVVMGADGTSGTGTPQQPVRMGDLSKGGVQDLVQELLNKAGQADQ